MKFLGFVLLAAAAASALPQRSLNFNPYLSYNAIRLPENPESRIVGGNSTDIAEFPYIVSLQFNGRHRCGANIISEQFVLTAAHCTSGLTATLLSIRAGSSYQEQGGVVVNIAQIFDHPQYDPSLIDYDFSVLRTAKALTFGKTIQSIPIAGQDEAFPVKQFMKTLGWGNTMNPNESNDRLRVVYVPKIDFDVCVKQYAAINARVTERMMCAGFPEGGRDACQGDSGGPLADGSYYGLKPEEGKTDSKLYGVVSWGFGCARPNFPGVYARIASVSDWVKGIAKLSY